MSSKKREQIRTVEASNSWCRVVLIEDFDKGVRTNAHRVVEIAHIDTLQQTIWVRTSLMCDEQLWAALHRAATEMFQLEPILK